MKKEEITMKSTKNEMLKAYNELLEKLKKKEEEVLKPEKMKEEKNKEEVISVVEPLTENGIIQEMDTFKGNVAKVISELSERMGQETEKYNKVKKAIEIKNKELEEIYGIEKEAHTLAALIESQKQRKDEFEEMMLARKSELEDNLAQRKADLEEEMKTIKELWKKEKLEHETLTKEVLEEEKKRRIREKEEYEYNFKREKELTMNKFADEKIQQTKQLSEQKDKVEKELAEREKNVSEREILVTKKESVIVELEKKVSAFNSELDAAVKKAIEDTKERLTTEFRSSDALSKKQFEGEINVLSSKISTLIDIVAEQKKQIAQQASQLEISYKKVEEIAMKALDSTSSSKTVSTIEQLIKDGANKQG